MRIETIETVELGDRSYLIHDGDSDTAVVVDPQRDIDRVLDLARALGVRIGLVVETHIHNDYVTGGYHLARTCGARYAVSAEDRVDFRRLGVADGDELEAGSLTVRVIATPGHTPTHLAYAISDATAAAGAPPAVFTGGSLLYGSVGRTDLIDAARTRELTRAQFRSARRLATGLSGPTTVHPTHGFGSFCSSGPAVGGSGSTIEIERRRNSALTEPDEQAFVDDLIAGLTPYPRYYTQMAPLNRRGPGPVDLSAPDAVSPAVLGERLAAGDWVIDVRDRDQFAADHLAGSVSIPLGAQFATWVGWLTPWGVPLTLIAESAGQVRDAQLQLARVGIERPAGAAAGHLDVLGAGLARSGYGRVTFGELPAPAGGEVILDVRRADEHASGHIAGAVHLPLPDLLARQAELPPGRLWVHCAAGYRSAIAASLLQRAGRDVIFVDDDYARAFPATPSLV